MSKAYKCDLCLQYFDRERGRKTISREVCDATYGFVKYRLAVEVHDNVDDLTSHEFCEGCLNNLLKAAANGERL